MQLRRVVPKTRYFAGMTPHLRLDGELAGWYGLL